MALTVGPSATLLCAQGCDARAAVATGCHYEGPATPASVAGDNTCDHVVLSAAALVREGRRGVSAPDGDHAVLLPRYRLADATIHDRQSANPGAEWWLEKRPLSTALRN